MGDNFPTNRSWRTDAAWLRKARLEHALHQHQLAAKLDINQGRVSEWETGIRPIPSAMLEKLKQILN